MNRLKSVIVLMTIVILSAQGFAEAPAQEKLKSPHLFVQHHDEMGGAFRAIKTVYTLNGEEVYRKEGEGIEKNIEHQTFNRIIAPGEHYLQVEVVYRGNGHGVFSYLNGYKFNVKSSFQFKAAHNQAIKIDVIAYERTTGELKERPSLRFQHTQEVMGGGAL